MGKETRIGVGVVGVLLVISLVVLYGRLTRDRGPKIDVNIGAKDPGSTEANVVERHPTIEREPGAYPTHSPISPAPQRGADPRSPVNQSFLPDPDGANSPISFRNLTDPIYQSPVPRRQSPKSSPTLSPGKSSSPATPVRSARRPH